MGQDERDKEISLASLNKLYDEFQCKYADIPDYFQCNYYTKSRIKMLIKDINLNPIKEDISIISYLGLPIEIDEYMPNNIIIVAQRPKSKTKMPRILQIINIDT